MFLQRCHWAWVFVFLMLIRQLVEWARGPSTKYTTDGVRRCQTWLVFYPKIIISTWRNCATKEVAMLKFIVWSSKPHRPSGDRGGLGFPLERPIIIVVWCRAAPRACDGYATSTVRMRISKLVDPCVYVRDVAGGSWLESVIGYYAPRRIGDAGN